MKLLDSIKNYRMLIRSNLRERNRFVLLIFTLMLVMDYGFYCLHVEKNVFDVFPAFPIMDSREELTIYLPDANGENLLTETRLAEKNEDQVAFVQYIVAQIVRGSKYENTRIVVPIECNVRAVWIEQDTCYIDIRLEHLDPKTPIVHGSEKMFKAAVEKSVSLNIPIIKSVVFLQNGIFKRDLWENSIDKNDTI